MVASIAKRARFLREALGRLTRFAVFPVLPAKGARCVAVRRGYGPLFLMERPPPFHGVLPPQVEAIRGELATVETARSRSPTGDVTMEQEALGRKVRLQAAWTVFAV